jgi:hypothetical protein
MQDVRHRYTLRLVEDLDERLVDWEGPDGQENAIGSLLYQIALAEMTWMYGDLKGLTEFPPAVKRDFPFPTWESDHDHLTRVLPNPKDDEEEITPEWVACNLVEHEAGHAFQISPLKARGKRHPLLGRDRAS